jgi:hypothetical protein
MKFAQALEPEKVIDTALFLVSDAKAEITATMNVNEEVRLPLTAEYHLAITEVISRGVKVIRFGYGKKENFGALKKIYKTQKIEFKYAGKLDTYQRMLIIDRKKGIFKLNDTVFYTEFLPLVQSLVKYVETGYNRETL